MREGFSVFDSEMHIFENPETWARYMDPAFKGLEPRLFGNHAGDFRMMVPTRAREYVLPLGSDDDPFEEGSAFHRSPQYEPGGRYFSARERGFDAISQLEAMDIEGIDRSVVFPTQAILHIAIADMDPDQAAAYCRAYNSWVKDYCQADPKRLLPAGVLSWHRVEDAVAETARLADMGFQAVIVRPEGDGVVWFDPSWEPLWALIEQRGLALCFHATSEVYLPQLIQRYRGKSKAASVVVSMRFDMITAMIDIIVGGVLDRHPGLRVAFLESNCGWAPWLLWRMDEVWELGMRDVELFGSKLPEPPSFYFKRQCFISVEPEEYYVDKVVDLIGDDNLVWSTDWPHGDSRYPDATKTLLSLPISETTKRKILWDNPNRLYALGTE